MMTRDESNDENDDHGLVVDDTVCSHEISREDVQDTFSKELIFSMIWAQLLFTREKSLKTQLRRKSVLLKLTLLDILDRSLLGSLGSMSALGPLGPLELGGKNR